MGLLDNVPRARRRLMELLVLGLLLIWPSALALQAGAAPEGYRGYLLASLAVGCLIAVPASLALTLLNLSGLRRPALGDELHDELSVRNAVRAMAVGFAAFAASTGLAIPLSILTPLPVAPVLTAILLLGVLAYLVSFALFERQGDDD